MTLYTHGLRPGFLLQLGRNGSEERGDTSQITLLRRVELGLRPQLSRPKACTPSPHNPHHLVCMITLEAQTPG